MPVHSDVATVATILTQDDALDGVHGRGLGWKIQNDLWFLLRRRRLAVGTAHLYHFSSARRGSTARPVPTTVPTTVPTAAVVAVVAVFG